MEESSFNYKKSFIKGVLNDKITNKGSEKKI